MTHLLLGEDLKSKDAKITQIKAAFFPDPQSVNFDFELLDAASLPADTLKKALITLPVLSPKRLVLLRNAHKLKDADADVLVAFLKKPVTTTDLILESSQTTFKGALKDLLVLVRPTVFSAGPSANVFDMTKLMAAGKPKESLSMLNGFYDSGTHPLQIMGGLVWFWGKEARALPKERFERGLKALEAADVNIKRSRLDPQYAVEKLVVELTGLLRSR